MSDPDALTRLVVRPLALGVALLIAGPLSATSGLVPPMVGFSMYALGALVAVLAGGIGGFLIRRRKGRWVPVAATGAVALLLVLVPALAGGGAPPINDITTSPDDPVPLDDGRALDGLGLPMDYDATFAPIQRDAYPDVQPIDLAVPPDQAEERVAGCLEQLGGARLTRKDGTVQATFTTRLFRFKDDVAARVVASGSGSRVDLRSRSRDGKGDLGANAARIEAIAACLASGAAGG